MDESNKKKRKEKEEEENTFLDGCCKEKEGEEREISIWASFSSYVLFLERNVDDSCCSTLLLRIFMNAEDVPSVNADKRVIAAAIEPVELALAHF